LDHVPTYVITNHSLQASPITTCHGRLVDGAASRYPRQGQDAVVFQAPEGMQIKVSAQTTRFSPSANIHIYDGPDRSAPELVVLRGASLDTREFVSSKGVLSVMRAVDLDRDAALPLIFSLGVGCTCKEGDNCGKYGSCVSGTCQCHEGYSGAMCENVDGDPCDAIDCGQHGQCVKGSCECTDRYTGSRCDQAPKPCCARDCGACRPSCDPSLCNSCTSGCGACGHGYNWCDDNLPGWDSHCDRSCHHN
jgi:hypothetical protein